MRINTDGTDERASPLTGEARIRNLRGRGVPARELELIAALEALADAYERLLADRLPARSAHSAAQMPVLVDARAAIANATADPYRSNRRRR